MNTQSEHNKHIKEYGYTEKPVKSQQEEQEQKWEEGMKEEERAQHGQIQLQGQKGPDVHGQPAPVVQHADEQAHLAKHGNAAQSGQGYIGIQKEAQNY